MTLLSVLCIGCTGEQPHREEVLLIGPEGQTVSVQAEIADEPAEWEQGLMNRETLGEYEGMLFVFPEEQMRKFWMKNTLIPLDIIYADADMNIVSMRTMIPCEVERCPLYSSGEPAQYALEVPIELARRNRITIDWRMQWPTTE